MSYYTLDQVKRTGQFVDIRRQNLTRKSFAYKTTVFLSHSHKDADIVESAIAFLLSAGIFVYVDWLDPTMPQTTSSETATKVKSKIVECEKFVVLLSENSKDSKWVPWELGFADGKKDNQNIAIMPIKRNSYTKDSEFDGLEYMHLYQRISINSLSGDSTVSFSARSQTLKSWLGG